MTEILIAATVIEFLVLGITGLIKTQVNNKKLLPVINVIAGILIAVLYAFSFSPDEIALYAWAGLIAGLSAGGLFDLGQSMKDKFEDIPDQEFIEDQEFTENTIHKK